MDFAMPERAREVCARLRALVDARVVPLEAEFFARGFGAVAPALEDVRQEARAAGLWAPQLPAALGGMGLPLLEFGLASRELGRSPLGHFAFNCQAPDAGNMELLAEFADAPQRERFLMPLARGEIRSCFAMTEPAFPGSNPTWMATTARREGERWVIDGRKWFTSSADGAAFAVVMAVTDPDSGAKGRASMFLVPLDTPGFRLVRNLPVMGESGEGWASHGEVVFEGCSVPDGALLGDRGAGFAMAQTRLGPGRIHHCMRWIGIAERAFELLCRHAMTRELAPGELLSERQTVQTWIADSRAQIAAATLLVLQAAWKIDREGARAAREEISMIKFHTARMLGDVLDRALQAHGALGMTDLTPLAYFYRHERAARIYDGPDEVHQSVVARAALRRLSDSAAAPKR